MSLGRIDKESGALVTDGGCLRCGTPSPRGPGPWSAFCPACGVKPDAKEWADRYIAAELGGAAIRFDSKKTRYDLIPHEWEEQLALLLTVGAQKYTDRNWEKSAGTPASAEWRARCLASLRRHLAAWQRGEILDPEHAAKGFDIHHMTAVAWNALVIMWYDAREAKK